jgi:hypothetical protein
MKEDRYFVTPTAMSTLWESKHEKVFVCTFPQAFSGRHGEYERIPFFVVNLFTGRNNMPKKLTSIMAVTAIFILAGSTQAGTLISGQDFRGSGDTNTLKAFNTLDGQLLWEVAAGNAKAGEVDPLSIDVTGAGAEIIVVSGGVDLGVTDDVRRYDVATGNVVGNDPLYNHGIGFSPGIAIDPVNGDIVHTAGSTPPGHNGLRLFDSTGGNQADFPSIPGLASGFDAQWHVSPSENRLFVLASSLRSPKAYLFNGVNFTISGQFPAVPASGTAHQNTEQMTINPNDNWVYATDNEHRVYQWDVRDSSLPPTEVVSDDVNLDRAAGLAFDEFNNLYISEAGPGPPGIGEVHIYKYASNTQTGTWDFESVFATIEPNVGIDNPGSFLQYVPSPDPPPTDFQWNKNVAGVWTFSSSWDPQVVPNSAEASVTFGGFASTATTAVVNTDITVNKITFGNASQHVVAGAGSVNLAATAAATDPAIEVLLGSHQFQAIVNLQANATANVGDSLTLSFNNELNLGGNTLTKSGTGNMAVNNKLTTAGGTIDIQEGTVSGSGTVGGNLNNSSGTVAPGNSPGILTIDGNYTQDSSGIMEMEIGGLVAGLEHDKIIITGAANLAGTLDVSLINSYSPNNGDTFDILDFGSVNGDFGTTNLPDNFSWDVATGVLTFMDVVGLTDYDNDGTWGLGDLNLVLFNWNEDGASLPAAWINSRPAGGTLVGLPELNQVLFSWGQPGSLATVPEPATLMLGCLGLLFGLRFRRRRSVG